MSRRTRSYISLGLCLLTFVSGCHPTQPYFFHEDGDLSHYMDVATTVEFPDVDSQTLDEVAAAQAPFTLANSENFQIWDLTLEEVTRLTLINSQVIRQLGGRVSDQGQNIANTTPQAITTAAAAVTTTYDPALIESGYGGNTGSPLSGAGVEAALSEFDAQLDSSIIWQKNDRPQNFGANNIFSPRFSQDLSRYTTGITKTAATGSTFEIRNNIAYDQNNNLSRSAPSDWNVNLEAAFTQPLLAGAGTQYNRIAGPRSFQESAGGFADQIDGVLISRIRYDITLSEFETSVRNLMLDVEDAYWELYFTYRDLEARKVGRDSALATWRRVNTLLRAGGAGGEASAEAQARTQYYLFQSQLETALTTVFRVESRLRYLMGLDTDGRLIRPVDEPTTAPVSFDWPAIHSEALARREELRRQKWQIKRRELELIAARNQLLPRLDLVGRYRWLGAGDELIDPDRNGISPFNPGSNAFESLTSGDFQEWEVGVQLNMPIGFRRGMAAVRHHQLLLAREREVLKEMELEVSHQLGDAKRDVDLNFGVAQTNFNQRVSAENEVQAVQAVYDVGTITLDQVLDAQSRRANAETAYYRSLVDYNRAIMRLHARKGSLLEYNGVFLAEGPWPGKAYFDALRRGRQRDASLYIDYGFTRPSVMSRGPYPQAAGTSTGGAYEGQVIEQPKPDEATPNQLPAEEVVPQSYEQTPPAPVTASPNVAAPASAAPAAATTLQLVEPLPAVTDASTPDRPSMTYMSAGGVPNPFARTVKSLVGEGPATTAATTTGSASAGTAIPTAAASPLPVSPAVASAYEGESPRPGEQVAADPSTAW